MRSWFLLFCLAFNSAYAELLTLPWPDLETELPLWKPSTQETEKRPAIVYYHGTNGCTNVHLFRKITKEKRFVIVGMTYLNKGRFIQSEANIAAELSQLNKLKRALISEHNVDPTKIYVAGFSKGGWFSATLLERDHSLAGGLILGAGVFHSKHPTSEPKPFPNKKPIFIGVGRFDGNYPQSLAALIHFRKLGAEITLEAWPDTKHAYPKTTPISMQQWLQLQSGVTALEAKQWIAQRRQAIDTIPDPIDQWHALEALQERPFVKAHGKHVKNQLAAKLTTLNKDPNVRAEASFVKISQDILKRELKDRYVTTLERVLTRYKVLAKKASGTRSGDIAEKDAARVRALLGIDPS